MDVLKTVGAKNIKTLLSRIPKDVDESTRKRFLYQIVGNILSNTPTESLGWEHPMYQQDKKEMDEYEAYLDKPFEVTEGVMECKRCRSKKTWSFQRQERSADEGFTCYVHCIDCGLQSKYRG